MDTSKLRVVIVNYRTADLVIRCVGSLLKHNIATDADIVIVDNFSPDDSVATLKAMLPNIRLVESKVNGGFGAGVNLGAAVSPGQYLLVLNPDTFFKFDSVSAALSYLDAHTDVAILGLDLVYPDGTQQFSGRRFYSAIDILARRIAPIAHVMTERVDRHLMKAQWRSKEVFDAEWVMGTGFIARSETFNAVGGMDDHYFLYMEDVDLCARIWQAGSRVQGMPGAQLVHDHQRASARGVSAFVGRAGREHLRSLLIFSRKFKLPLFRQPGTQAIVLAYNRSGFVVRRNRRKSESLTGTRPVQTPEDTVGA